MIVTGRGEAGAGRANIAGEPELDGHRAIGERRRGDHGEHEEASHVAKHRCYRRALPGFPAISSSAAAVTASIFARLREHLARFPGDVIPLHIGDTYLPPAVSLDALDWRELPQAELYAYGAPPGWTPLIDAIVGKL